MERGILLRQLVVAEQSVAEIKSFTAQQQRLIVQSERDGQDAAETIRLLDKLLLLQQSREQEREDSRRAFGRVLTGAPPKQP
jgi:hypothetical protein